MALLVALAGVLVLGCSRTIMLPSPPLSGMAVGGAGQNLTNGTGLLLAGNALSVNQVYEDQFYLGVNASAANSLQLAGQVPGYYVNRSALICYLNGTNCPAAGNGSGGWVNTSQNVTLVDPTDNVSAGALRVDNTNAQVLVNGSINITGNMYLHGPVTSYSPMVFQTDGVTRMILNDTVGTLDTLYGMRLMNTSGYPVAGMNLSKVWWPGNDTGSIGGSLLNIGVCTSGTTRVLGARAADVVIASPQTYPGDGVQWQSYVSSNDTVTVKVCGVILITPTASIYHVRVIG